MKIRLFDRALALAAFLIVVLSGAAHGAAIPFTGFYEGPFTLVDASNPAAVRFEAAVQSSTNAVPDLSFQLAAVWSTDTTVGLPFVIYDGSSIFLGPAGILDTSFSGTATPAPGQPDIINFDVTVLFTGGEVNGEAVIGGSGLAVGQLNSTTGISSGSIDGTIFTTPEPGTAILLGLGLVALGVARLRK